MLDPNEIEKRLEELKDCENIRIVLKSGENYITKILALINYPKEKFIEDRLNGISYYYENIINIQSIPLR